MGWTQRRIRSWVLEEFAVGAGLLAVAGIVLSLLSWNIATAIVSASVLALYPARPSSPPSSCATATKSTRNRSTTNGSSLSTRR